MGHGYRLGSPKAARLKEQRNLLEEDIKMGQCPFCPGGHAHLRAAFVDVAGDSCSQPLFPGWRVFRHSWPSDDVANHLDGGPLYFVAISSRCIAHASELLADEFHQIGEIMRFLQDQFGSNDFSFFCRSGDPDVSGTSITHLHVHFFVPNGQKLVGFGVPLSSS